MHPSFSRTGITLSLLASVLLSGGCATKPPAMSAPDTRNIVVARVNGIAVTEATLDSFITRMTVGAPPTDAEDARKRALDRLIVQELAVQEAERKGLHPKPEEVDRGIRRLILSLGHEDGFANYLKTAHTTEEEVRGQIARGVLLQMMYTNEVTSKVTISPEAVKKEYDQNKKEYVSPEKVTVVDVAFPTVPDLPPAKSRAEAILTDLKSGKIAGPRSLQSTYGRGVQERDIERNREPALFDAARKLSAGALSGVIEAPDGAHILQVVSHAPERQLSWDEAKSSAEAKLRKIAEWDRIREWERELKKDAKIELFDAATKP